MRKQETATDINTVNYNSNNSNNNNNSTNCVQLVAHHHYHHHGNKKPHPLAGYHDNPHLPVPSSPKRYRLVLFSLALLVVPYLPASNLLFPVGFVIAERILYLPSMGACLLVAMAMETIAVSEIH